MTTPQSLYVFLFVVSIFLIQPSLTCHTIQIYPQFFGNSGAVYNTDGIAFVAQGVWADKLGVSEILVFNGTNPQDMFLVDVQSLTYSPTSLAMSSDDNYLYISSTSCLLQVMDISTPASPVLLTTPDPALAYYGYQIALSPDETVAYVASSSGIFGIDIQQPKVPLRLFQLKMKAGGVRVSADGTYIYVLNQTTTDGGLAVISVGNGSEPAIKANLNTGYGYSLAESADSQYLYLLRAVSLVVIDISIPSFPQLLTSLDLPASVPYDFQVIFSQIMMYENNLLFLAFDTQVLIVNVTVSHNPEYVATFLSPVPLNVISGYGDYYLGLSAAQGIVTFDFESSNNWNASVVIPTNAQTTSSDTTAVSTNANQTLLFTTDFSNGLLIYDISEIMKKMEHLKEGHHHHGEEPAEVDSTDPTDFDLLGLVSITNASSLLYCEQKNIVAVGNSLLLTLVNVSEPTDPEAVGFLATLSNAMYFSEDCNTLYLGVSQSLAVYNVTDITDPSIIGQYQQLDGFNGVVVNSEATYAFTCANGKNFQVLDIQDLNNIRIAFTSNVTSVPSCTNLVLTPDENYAIVLTKLSLIIFNITNPTNPIQVNSYTSLEAGQYMSLSPEGDYIAVSTQTQLVIFNIGNINTPIKLGAYDAAGLIHGIQLMDSGSEVYLAADTVGVQIITISEVSCVQTSSIVGPFVTTQSSTTAATTTGSTTDNDSSPTKGQEIVVTIVEVAVAILVTAVGVGLVALGVFLYMVRRREFMTRRKDGYGIISNVAKEDIETSYSSSNKYKNKFGTNLDTSNKTPEIAEIVGPYNHTPSVAAPISMKRQEAVIKRATKNLNKDAKNSGELEKRAVAFMYIGKYELAIEDSTKMISLDPNNKPAYFVRAYCFMRLHDASRAIVDCEQYLNLANSSQDLNNAYSINDSLTSLPQVSKLPANNSMKFIKKKNEDELEINYDNEIHYVMGGCLQYLRKFDQAIKELQLYLNNEPADSKSLWMNEAKERIEYCQQELNVLEFNEKSLEFQTEDVEEGKVIGKGEFGIVFQCKNKKNGGVYAAKKVMLASLSNVDQRRILVQKLEGEIDILKRMKHPNIVQLVACAKSVEGNFTLYMDLYDGNLGAVINEKTLMWQKNKNQWFSPKELKLFCVDILSGVAYLHANKIAHRDLKSDNILVRLKTSRNVVSLHVADFGMSKIFGGAETLLASTVSGTLSFMAPEVAQGWYEGKSSQYDPFKADVWSFGMVLFELLSPGMRATATPRDILIGKVPNLPPSTAEKSEYQIFVCLFQDCTVLDPKRRPTAKQLLEIISQYDPTK